jgi:o-succinylbenzoate synthase
LWLFFEARAQLGGEVRLRLEIKKYRLPLRVAVRTAHGVMTEREGVWLRIEDEARRVGIAEAATLPWFGTETAEEAEAVLRGMGEWVEEERLREVPARLGCVRNAVGEARAMMGEGGEGNGKDVEREGSETKDGAAYLSVAALLPAGLAVLEAIGPKAEAGFRVFKWKVGVGDLADELTLLDDVCAKLPEGAKLRLDANGAWDRRRAEKWLERCVERPVEFVEQPIAREARGAEDVLRGLAEDYPVEIALDESLVGDGDVERWVGAGWRGVFVVKPSLVGDARGALARLEKAGAKVVFSSALETAVGARAALRWAFAWKGERRAVGFGVWPLFADGRFDGPAAAPFVRREDVERIDVEALWNALS